jgi:hypothetical protein
MESRLIISGISGMHPEQRHKTADKIQKKSNGSGHGNVII